MYYQIAMPYSTLFFIFFYVYYPYISDENKKTSDRSKKRMISFGIPSSLTVIIFYFSVCKLPAAFEAGPYTSISGLNSVYLFICFFTVILIVLISAVVFILFQIVIFIIASKVIIPVYF